MNHFPPTMRFPGAVYAGSGKSLHRRRRDLSLEALSSYPHRAVVRRELGAEIARVWILADDASAEMVPERIQNETLEYVWAGVALLLLSHRPEPILSVRSHLEATLAIAALMQRNAVAA